MTKRSDERANFLANVLTTAIEGGSNYWAAVSEYRWGYHDIGQSNGQPLPADQQAYAEAVIEDSGDFADEDPDFEPTKVDLETIAKGLGLLRAGELQYIAPSLRANILLADRTNGDEGDIDAVDADAILQLGVFGEVIYG